VRPKPVARWILGLSIVSIAYAGCTAEQPVVGSSGSSNACSKGAITTYQVGSVGVGRRAGGFALSLDSADMVDTRAKLLATTNFGAGGTVSTPIAISDIVAPLDAAVLSGIHVFYAAPQFGSSSYAALKLSAAELAALVTWVEQGGVLIAACDSSLVDDVCTTFGHEVRNPSYMPTVPATGQAGHPLFDGPFGASVSGIRQSRDQSYFIDTTGTTVVGQDTPPTNPLPIPPPNPTILVESRSCGHIVYIGDADMISDLELSSGTGIVNDNDRFLGNLFAYAGSMIP